MGGDVTVREALECPKCHEPFSFGEAGTFPAQRGCPCLCNVVGVDAVVVTGATAEEVRAGLAALLKIERAIADPAITRDTITKLVDEAIYPDGKKPWANS